MLAHAGRLDADSLTPAKTLERLRESGREFMELFAPSSLVVQVYRPDGVDRQTPHTRDEVHVVISGSAWFVNGERRHRFEGGLIASGRVAGLEWVGGAVDRAGRGGDEGEKGMEGRSTTLPRAARS